MRVYVGAGLVLRGVVTVWCAQVSGFSGQVFLDAVAGEVSESKRMQMICGQRIGG